MLTLMSPEIITVLVWVGIILLTGVIEASTMDLTSIWFAGGALAALIALLFGANIYVQVAIFIVVSAGLLLSLRPIFWRYLKKNDIKTNVDRLIGKIAICTEKIAPDEHGEVKIDGKIWTAVAHESVQVGEKVEVLAIEGVKLVVKKPE